MRRGEADRGSAPALGFVLLAGAGGFGLAMLVLLMGSDIVAALLAYALGGVLIMFALALLQFAGMLKSAVLSGGRNMIGAARTDRARPRSA